MRRVTREEALRDETSKLQQLDDMKPIPLVVSGGDLDYKCGHCGFTICENLTSAAQVTGMYLNCPRCREWNRTRN